MIALDLRLHFFTALGMTLMIYCVGRGFPPFALKHYKALEWAAKIVIILSVGYEIMQDLDTNGMFKDSKFSVADLFADLLGFITSVIILQFTFD